MSTTLLVTKLYIPLARSNQVPRPRLTARLIDSSCPLVLVCAPAGFGKTTLLSEQIVLE